MILAFILGLIIIFNILFIYCLINISKLSEEREVNYERKNKKLVKSSRNKSN